MSKIYIERNIAIPPNFLNENYESKIFEKIKKEYCGKCDENVGYILNIFNYKILSNYISNEGKGIILKVKFKAECFKPEKAKEYEGKVCMIFDRGIFVEVFDLMKVLINIEDTGGYEYKNDVLKKGKNTIKMGDTVSFVIQDINYEKKNYQVFGSLKNKKDK